MQQPPRFAMVAGEASGDLLAGLVLDGMRARWPALSAQGIGGPQMAARGFQAWWPSDKLAVSGYVEVLRHYRELVGIRKQLKERLLKDRPNVFIGVDAPDFNLGLEQGLKEQGVPTVHFICPSIWAWRPERVETIRRSADHVLCIFPFEPELLARNGIAATYVGHPLAGVIPLVPDKAAARRALGLQEGEQVIAILPGSRRSEVKNLAETFFLAAALVQRAHPAIKLIAPAVPGLASAIEEAARAAGLERGLQVLQGQSHLALTACDLVLVASGTATLEAALFKRPMVIAYKVNWLTYRIMWPKRLQPWVGLPNVLCRDFVVPELLQHDATPEKLAAALLEWLEAPARIAAIQARFTALHHELRRDTKALATDAIEKVIAR
ncbi:lipid-A-disaccharide synthase [uncultured Ramlibacter sp.]|uniref:lipid-A-disaccharide synthase n=1 Tax=uncultured Ramlibacter sp. TaxID=260755 RepID=UPI00262290D1|nr:lipid-A-disaccharide synthase [uncultured Ramlibacter sp.]